MRLHESRLVCALLCASLIVSGSPLPLLAQDAPPPPVAAPADAEAALQRARESIKSGEYDQAIETLKGLIGQPRLRVETLRETYLLLIKAYVYHGNDYKRKEQGREASILHYNAARERIAECLRIPELRHTRPEPESDYPEEMVTFFKDVRAQILGSFRVSSVSPAGAIALMDSDTLRTAPGDLARGDVDLSVGQHLVVVRYPGFRDVTEQVTIAPGATLERSYQLTKRRGRLWYASRVGVALGVVGGIVAVLARPGATSSPTPLPEAPPPPTSAR